jgi:hypothetical protein
VGSVIEQKTLVSPGDWFSWETENSGPSTRLVQLGSRKLWSLHEVGSAGKQKLWSLHEVGSAGKQKLWSLHEFSSAGEQKTLVSPRGWFSRGADNSGPFMRSVQLGSGEF